jgi:hypothetical protein
MLTAMADLLTFLVGMEEVRGNPRYSEQRADRLARQAVNTDERAHSHKLHSHDVKLAELMPLILAFLLVVAPLQCLSNSPRDSVIHPRTIGNPLL